LPPPVTHSREVPSPSIATPIIARNWQNSCTRPDAAFISVEVPLAAVAHSAKPVVVTDA
jgi:hypothetical protein